MNQTAKSAFAAMVAFTAVCATAFEYNVTRPSICPQWSGAEAGKWTMDREAAFAKAKADVAYTIVMFTGSWWCPICQTCESKVLTSQAWADYVAKEGFYLVECDYPYRFPVPEGQEWKGTSPLGDGWGFQCWLYDADYLAQNGLTAEDGLAAIQAMYDYQDALALPDSTVDVIGRLGGGTMDLHKIAYPSMILFRPDGSEVGRVMFPRPWYTASSVSDEEAIDFMIGNLETLLSGEGGGLYGDPTAGGLLGKSATIYDGWLEDSDGVVAGSISVKAAKANLRTGAIKITATVQPTDGKKANYTGSGTISTNAVIVLEKKNSSKEKVSLKLGANGMTGVLSGGAKMYSIKGGRNVFKAKDDASKAAAETAAKGCWSIALKTANDGGSAFSHGYSGLSVTVGNKGKVKIAGTLGDGTKATATAQAVVGENGVVCVPVTASLYSKKGGYSLLLTFKSGRLDSVTGISSWKAVGKPATFTATWSDAPVISAQPGSGEILSELALDITGFDNVTSLNGNTIAISPNSSAISASKNKWTGVKNVSDLKVTYKPKDLTFKGSLNIYVTDPNGKSKKIKGTLMGVVVNGTPYGTLVIKDVGTWAVVFASACGGGC